MYVGFVENSTPSGGGTAECVRCRRRCRSPRRRVSPRTLATLLPRVAQVIDQTTRRVLHGEAVPTDEMLVSRFEAHTDVLVKDRHDTYYGRNIFLTTGGSGLILDGAIPKGNPSDVPGTVPLVCMACAWRITCETCPHYLVFSSDEIADGAGEF